MKKSELNKHSGEYKEGTRFIIILCLIGFLFLSVVGYLTYLELWGKHKFMDNAYNQRQWAQEEKILRGEMGAARKAEGGGKSKAAPQKAPRPCRARRGKYGKLRRSP